MTTKEVAQANVLNAMKDALRQLEGLAKLNKELAETPYLSDTQKESFRQEYFRNSSAVRMYEGLIKEFHDIHGYA
jgi:hypothetical protein